MFTRQNTILRRSAYPEVSKRSVEIFGKARDGIVGDWQFTKHIYGRKYFPVSMCESSTIISDYLIRFNKLFFRFTLISVFYGTEYFI